MKCPNCGCLKSRIIESRYINSVKRRRRECTQCLYRFHTYEGLIEDLTDLVLDKDMVVAGVMANYKKIGGRM